jgi:hypothetical protein
MKKTRSQLHILLITIALVTMILPSASFVETPVAQAQGSDAVRPLLVNTIVSDWTVAAPRLVWLTYPTCPTPPPGLADAATQAAGDPVTISRISTNGSQARRLFARNDPRAPGACNPYKLNSNIIADESYVYFVDGSQLVRLSVNANPGDAPQPWGPTFIDAKVELSMGRDHIVTLQVQDCNFCLLGTRLNLITKADGSSVTRFQRFETGNSPRTDGKYMYYKDVNNDLYRLTPGDTSDPLRIAQAVSDYLPESEVTLCDAGPIEIRCTTTSYVFYIQNIGNNSIVRFNNLDGGYQLIYLPNPGGGQIAKLYGLTLGNRTGFLSLGQSLFFFEKRYVPCPVPPGCFVTAATDLLRSTGRAGGAPDDLHFRNTDSANFAKGLTSDGFTLYWLEESSPPQPPTTTILRMPTNAATLPKINLKATGIEITQGIQRSDNGVPLIQLRPTFVRVFAQADGQSVPGVTAQLRVSASGVGTAFLSPVNPDIGSRIRVFVNPSRGVTNDSFLFELPWQFTQASDLRIEATVNPFGVPLEPTLADNTVRAGPFAFNSTPRLSVTFVEFNYRLNNTNYSPKGTLANVNWIRRVYPLGASIGVNGWNHGLNYNIWQINDAGLAARVNRQSPECDAYVTRKSDGTIDKDNREFCASDYVNGVLRDLRSRRSVPAGTFLYGEIPDPGIASQFPRGQEGGSSVSSGPDGPSWNGFYAGHEIGHSLGLGHPKTANGSCNLEGSDPEPPHPNGWIGKGDSSIVGFDSRDGTFGGKRGVLAGASYFDMMAYCQPQWISDVNYERIYKRLTGAVAVQQVVAAQEGDWLSVYGSLDAAGERAAVSLIRRLAGTVDVEQRVEGDYTLRLLDGQSAPLADYRFTPEGDDDGAERSAFGLVVPFVNGTRQIQITRVSTGAALYSQAISANPPSISGVGLQNAPNPAGGVVTLTWNAADADGDSLRYDVLFSRDGGSSFKPLLQGLNTTNTLIDTALVGGGSVIFRVVGTDGVQATQADSAPVAIAPQPPQPRIFTPAGTTLEWGQLLSLRGEAADAQDGLIASSGLAWSNQKGPLGAGPQLAVADLPVGPNVITLTATNSAGLSASTSITVQVGDDLSEPGPTLLVNPPEISWPVESGSSTPQTATLTLVNVGGGSLKWTAAAGAPWLSLSATAGDEGQSLTVSANPGGFADNSSVRAEITLQAVDSAGQPFQTVIVPVTVFVGNPGFGPPTGSLYALHLPLVKR